MKEFSEYVLSSCKLYKDIQGNTYAQFDNKDIAIKSLLPIYGDSFSDILHAMHDQKYGSYMQNNLKKATVHELNIHARLKGRLRTIYHRYAVTKKAIYINPGNNNSAYKITKNGINKVSLAKCACKFVHNNNMLAMPTPLSGTDTHAIDMMWEFLSLKEEYAVLLSVWLLNVCFIKNNQPIVVFIGKEGSRKSTIQRLLKLCIDPSEEDLNLSFNSIKDLAAVIHNNYVVSLDNAESLSKTMQNMMCDVSTGGNYITKKLYSDRTQSITKLKRPLMINGVTNFINASDLLDRCLLFKLERLNPSERKVEASIEKEIANVRKVFFGWLINSLHLVLKTKTIITPSKLPRMAGFYHFGLRVESALGWKKGTFEKAFLHNQSNINKYILEKSNVAYALLELKERGRLPFRGTYKDLLDILRKDGLADVSSERALSEEIKNISHRVEKQYKIKITKLKNSNKGHRLKIEIIT